ncbi:hypothetical protein [Candidatus Formimonas warabiya]|uniref:Uncharacterized protein n=1 Tax=Formimonas warabiya TaxID=1761012 RepID=A0A3G1KP02_FORW1|nr:hypothetical protein [Candidatus Formimonas warabiya]ATW24150.1 hypothetical protein DCMF_04565 [Candidatus Formimonas warabiya]
MCTDLILYEVTVLKAHNSTRGIKKAPGEKYYCLGTNPVEVKDLVEIHDRIPGIKFVLSVRPVSPEEYFDHSKLIS